LYRPGAKFRDKCDFFLAVFRVAAGVELGAASNRWLQNIANVNRKNIPEHQLLAVSRYPTT
jgi:hypothetical protein